MWFPTLNLPPYNEHFEYTCSYLRFNAFTIPKNGSSQIRAMQAA